MLLSLVLCVWFVDRCLSLCTFSFGHFVVCSSLIYGFWLPFWCFVVIVLSVLLRYTDSDYPFGILWSLSCVFFLDMRILITPLVSSNSSCIKLFGSKKTTVFCYALYLLDYQKTDKALSPCIVRRQKRSEEMRLSILYQWRESKR